MVPLEFEQEAIQGTTVEEQLEFGQEAIQGTMVEERLDFE